MEMSSNLTLNEEALAKVPESKKALFVFEWLQFLQNVLVAAQKVKQFTTHYAHIILINFYASKSFIE